MKLKTPTKTSIKNTAINVTSATVGGMLSEGVVNLIPAKTLANNEVYIRGGIALGSAVAASAISGNGMEAQAAKMLLAGMSIVQIIKALPMLAKKFGISKPSEDASTSEKFAKGILGLNCPCEQDYSATPVVRMPRLNGLKSSSPYDFAGQNLENFGFSKGQRIAVGAFD
jgi:hypothetical protein